VAGYSTAIRLRPAMSGAPYADRKGLGASALIAPGFRANIHGPTLSIRQSAQRHTVRDKTLTKDAEPGASDASAKAHRMGKSDVQNLIYTVRIRLRAL
jgi:hypothetical protein